MLGIAKIDRRQLDRKDDRQWLAINQEEDLAPLLSLLFSSLLHPYI